jgi:twinfilin-like protein
MEDVRAATIASSSEGSAARRNHLGGAGVQINWPENVSAAVSNLASVKVEVDTLVVLSIDTATETLVLSFERECAVDEVGSQLPSDMPG